MRLTNKQKKTINQRLTPEYLHFDSFNTLEDYESYNSCKATLRISEVIKALKKAKKEHGDLHFFIKKTDVHSLRALGPYFSPRVYPICYDSRGNGAFSIYVKGITKNKKNYKNKAFVIF